MAPTATNAFRSWLKSGPNMKLSSDAAVTRILYEGITTFDSLNDFDEKSIQDLPGICKETIPAITADPANGIAAENEVPGANISSISVRRLIVAANAAKYYISIGRTMTTGNMHYNNVLRNFKIEWDAYESLEDQDEPTIPKVNDKDHDRKIIRWAPIFMDCLSRTYGSQGPLSYVLRDDVAVSPEATDPLNANSYYGSSGSLIEELIQRLPHAGAVYRNDNASVYSKIEEAVRGTSVESTIKAFARQKDGRGAFLALSANHANDTKYRSISKKRMHLLQNVKWNGRAFPLENHVSNHRQAHDDLLECSNHITVPVLDQSQRVEYLIDSISCTDNTLQAAIGLIRANTNGMRTNFDLAASTLIEVDPYRRSFRNNGRNANVSSIDFNAGRGSTGVDLRWHHPKEFRKLPRDQKDELTTWLKTDQGKRHIEASKKEAKKRKRERESDKNGEGGKNNWRRKMQRAMKTDEGLKSIMAIMAEEEKNNTAFIAALHTAPTPVSTPAPLPPPPTTTPVAPPAPPQVSSLSQALPATNVKLQSILKKGKKS